MTQAFLQRQCACQMRNQGLNRQTFDVSGYRSNSSASILVIPNGGAGQSPTYQPASTGLYFWKRLSHGSGSDPWDQVQVTENGTTLDFGYQYVPPATESPTYDLDDNLLTDGRYNYTWDAEPRRLAGAETDQAQLGPQGAVTVRRWLRQNRLKMITWTAAQSPINQAGQIFFTYDGLSRLIARQHEGIDGDNEPFIVEYAGYLYDAWNHILTVRLNLDHTVRGRVASYVWGPDIGSRWLGQSSWQQAGGVGGLLMVIDGVATSQHSGTTWDPIDDDYVDSLAPHARLALRAAVGGLPRLPPVALVPLMDRMGNVTGYKKAHTSVPAAQLDAIYDYDAFGQEIRSTGPAADIVPYHFSTKRVDSTGLVYYGYRWYDPAKGRWPNRDPIGERGGINLYGMVGNDPVNRWDYLGLDDRGVSQRYCDAAAKYPQNSWLKCACGVSREIDLAMTGLVGTMLITDSSSHEYGGMRDRAKWFRCMRSCMVEKWEAALNKWEGHPMDKKQEAKLTPAWNKFCKDCQGDKVSEPECCKKQVEAEQDGMQSCMDNCGKWEWGNSFPVGQIPNKPEGFDFNSLQDRIKYGLSRCCGGGK